MLKRLRQIAGAIVFDWPGFERNLRRPNGWLSIRNRNERIRFDDQNRGVICEWQWTSDLHLSKVFPRTGLRLMNTALKTWPIRLADQRRVEGPAAVSFVIGHRGMSRLPNLLMTVKSIAAQIDVPIECIVVEQSTAAEAKPSLPSWVRHIHTPPPDPQMPYSRSWALNVGARAAKGTLLVLHDNDMLVPEAYARELKARARGGAAIIDLKRFTFYLSRSHSEQIFASGALQLDQPPETIVQNLQGATVAVQRDAYFDIGGFDESFVGWGGEDNEFWERAATRVIDSFGYLPFVHLWHAAQPEKLVGAAAPGTQRYHQLATIPPVQRIASLSRKPFGSPAGPQL